MTQRSRTDREKLMVTVLLFLLRSSIGWVGLQYKQTETEEVEGVCVGFFGNKHEFSYIIIQLKLKLDVQKHHAGTNWESRPPKHAK